MGPMSRVLGLLALLAFFLFPTLSPAQVRDIVVEPTRIVYQGKALYQNSWAVLIGINRYRHPRIPALSYALNDVKEMREALLRLGFAEDRILTLQEDQATKRGLESLLGGRLPRMVGPEDRVVIFFSGHGKDEELPDGRGEGYIVPVDADPDQLYATAISMTSLTDIAKRLRAKHVLYLVDACYSGYAFYPGRSIVNPELVEELTRGKAVQVMTAGRRGETVEERDGLGIFTRALVAGLKGQADEKNWGWVSVTRLGEYVRDRVFTESRQRQLPQFGNLSGEGQVVFVLPGESRLPGPPLPPGPGPGVPARDPVADLLARADGLIARQALTTPPGANAYEVLQEILLQNPNHPGALDRLRRMADTYKGWARQDIERGQKERARRYLEAAKRIFPEDREIAELKDRLVKLEAEGRKAAEAEKRRIEGERRKSEEVARAEAERRRLEEERRLSGERARVESERRRLEEERERLAALQREREERERRERERVAVAPPAMPHERSFPPDNRPMVLVPSGEFIMGDNHGDGDPNERPSRRVYLDAYYIDKYPITNEDYRKFMGATGHRTPDIWGDSRFNAPRQPVVGVSWDDAVAYCRWAGKRLPTEAEWEKAARGPDGRKYPWGNEWDPSKAIFSGNSGNKTHPVDRTYNTHRSPYGAVDMAGNVWQWVADWFDSGYYARGENRNPKGPASGSGRALRGGSWVTAPWGLRTSDRNFDMGALRAFIIGFRCSRSP